MGVDPQFVFDWQVIAAAQSRQAGPDLGDLVGFVTRARVAGIRTLRQLKRLVDAAVRAEELVITDEDIPF